MSDSQKVIHVLGGGTVYHVRNHLALSAPAYGSTAVKIAKLCESQSKLAVKLHLTRMADPSSSIETNQDVADLVDRLVAAESTKIVFFSAAMVDFEGYVGNGLGGQRGKHAERLSSLEPHQTMALVRAPKIIEGVRKKRKDIFLVGFKTVTDKDENHAYLMGLRLLKNASCNLVLVNDVVRRYSMIVTPEEARYHYTTDRNYALYNLVDMALLRSHLTFTRSTVVDGEPIPWSSDLVPSSLRTIVDHCIKRGAYKPFAGSTVGHFAVKLDNNMFLTSRRKTNFNEMAKVGLVRIKTDGPDSVIAYGSKPSVGGQSQRIVFQEHPGYDCIVHFHCPIKSSSKVPQVSQREYECGSHECGQNTSRGLGMLQLLGENEKQDIKVVYLQEHGPNVLFNRAIDPKRVIDFIEANFDLDGKTGGPVYEQR